MKWIARTVLAVAMAGGTAQAAIEVQGVAPRKVYADQVTFQVVTEADSAYAATLNGEPVATGAPVTIESANYYELWVQRTPLAGGANEERTIPFIVRDSERGNSEWGLPPWTPYPVVDGAPEEFAGGQLRLIAPAAWPAGMELPLAAWLERGDGTAIRANGRVTAPGLPTLQLRRGAGSVLALAPETPGPLVWEAGLPGVSAERVIEVEAAPAWTEIRGTLAGATTWPPDSRIFVADDVTVPAGAALTIGAGSVIRLAPETDWLVRGQIVIAGSAERPVFFVPENAGQPWGGFDCRGGAARLTFTHTVLVGGGVDPNWFGHHPDSGHSHRHEQPVIYLGDGARAELTDCCLFDLRGQAAHGEDAFFTLDRCLVQRCITVGQFNGGQVNIRRGALLEFPRDDGVFSDDDNDALYLTEGTHTVSDTLIGWARDDGIDAGSGSGGTVTVTNCWLESCFHEGLAWSGSHRSTRTIDTVLMNCGQGIEAGWSSSANSPDVFADHCLLLGNAVGARFGDNYDWSYNGFLRLTNSLVLYNDRDVWGMNWDDWTYREAQMDIRGNLLTAPNPHHPDNGVFDGARDGARLLAFLPPVARVGAGIAWRRGQASRPELPQGVPVGLSRFTADPVTVAWEWRAADGFTTTGTVAFAVGQTVAFVPLPEVTETDGPAWLRLADGEHSVVTGRAWLMLSPSINADAQTLVARGSVWRYLDDGSDQGTAWRAVDFDDSDWPAGPAELGYGDGDEATVVNSGPSSAHYATTWFRHAFEVADPAAFSSLELGIRRDDGALVWLNGVEVFRTNLPDGPVDYRTYTGKTTSSETDFFTTKIPPDRLRPRRNVLAVEIHQANAHSSDISFDLWLTARWQPRLHWLMLDGQLLLYWDDASFGLEQASAITGPWEFLPNAESPHLVEPGTSRFFRLRQR